MPNSFFTNETDSGAGNPDCQICKGGGYIITGIGNVIPCECVLKSMAAKREKALLARCKLPPKAVNCTLKNFNTTNVKGLNQAYKAACSMAEEKGNLLWLSLVAAEREGKNVLNNDTGKSHLAMAVCNRWLERGRPARYAAVPTLADELKRGFGDGSYNRIKQDVLTVSLLAIDDLGAGRNTPDGRTQYTPWLLDELESIFQYREDNLLHTIVTSNLTLNQIGEDISYRIKSRIERASPGVVIVIDAIPYTQIRKNAIKTTETGIKAH